MGYMLTLSLYQLARISVAERIQGRIATYLIDFLNAEWAIHMPKAAKARTTSQHNHRGSGFPPAIAAGSRNIIRRRPSIV